MRTYVLLFFLLLSSFVVRAQVLINEVSSASCVNYLDEDGDQEDWIELYNAGSSAVNLQDYELRTTSNGKTKSWKFPSIIVPANEFLTVFCSEKNRREYFDHWEVPVYANMPWKYFPGSTNPPSNWRSNTFNDASWATGIGGIGYGDGDDSTVIAPVNSVMMRAAFTIADTSKIPTAALLLDFDDGFVAYLNDVEIARYNVGVYGDRPAYNVSAYDEHEATMYQSGEFSGGFIIAPEVMDSALRTGLNVFSIQVHNVATGMDDLSAFPYFLIGVNDTAVTYYPFDAEVFLHTSFNLESTGFLLELRDASGAVADQKLVPAMQLNHTYGRRSDGGSNWYFFDTPTPWETNNSSSYYSGYAGKPSFTVPAGFYPSARTVALSSTGEMVRYTLDGSDPSQGSAIYTGPVSIDSTTVLRARCFSSDPFTLPGEIITNTYFINENTTLPVVSLVSDPANLFDENTGIYVFGPNADTVNIPFFGSNFWNGWERPGHIEYFDKYKHYGFETPAALSIQGNYSKAWPQRGFTVKTRDNYKGQTINYPLFPAKPHIREYKSFNIRNAGSDWNTCHMRDRFNQKTVQRKTDIDIMDGESCLLFINGKYWGVYELRERQDKHYIENNFGYKQDQIDLLEFDGNIVEGRNDGFLNMAAFIAGNDMSVESNYAQASAMLDMENFADYFITETFVANIDWLGSYTNNIKFWKPRTSTGKWRYMLWDTDLSLGFAAPLGTGQSSMDMLDLAINPPTLNPHSMMLKSLLDNTGFRHHFVNRYADLMNTIFSETAMHQRAYSMRDQMMPEMERHFDMWGGSALIWSGFIGRSIDVPSWIQNVDSMLMFTDERLDYARDQIEDQFGLVKQVEVGLHVEPAGAGSITINTIEAEVLPWTGIYFDGVPVTMTVTPKPGFQFKYWKSDSVVSEPYSGRSLTVNVNTDDDFTAYFEPLENYFDVFPNPFSDELTLVFKLPSDKQVSITITNALGQVMMEPVSDNKPVDEGVYTLKLQTADLLAEGVYFVSLRTRDYTKTVKLVKTKQ